MKKLLKSYWFTKILILVFILSIGFNKTNAQSTFFIKIGTWGGYFPNVFEDEKGCILAKYDFGLTRISPDGRILWKTRDNNLLSGACIRDSQYYVFPALDSEMGGFRFQAIDYKGKTVWMERENFAEVRMRTVNDFIIDSARRQYIVSGDRGKVGDLKNIYYWIAGLDYRGHILWEREWRDSGESRYFKKILKNKKTGGYMLLTQDFKDQFRKELFNVDTAGKLIERNFPEPNPCKINISSSSYRLKDIISYNDTMFLATFSTFLDNDCPLEEGNYFYFYNSNGKLIKRLANDWAVDYLKQAKDKKILIWAGNFIGKLNANFQLEWAKEIFPVDEKAIEGIEKVEESRDGGFIGIAQGVNIADENYVFVFKTDSLGNINPTEEYEEKQQPVMLQPNPANNQVRITIPYYYGTVAVEFYTMLGEFLYKKTKSEQDMYDISSLSPGMYIIKAKIEETGEERTMRLVVE